MTGRVLPAIPIDRHGPRRPAIRIDYLPSTDNSKPEVGHVESPIRFLQRWKESVTRWVANGSRTASSKRSRIRSTADFDGPLPGDDSRTLIRANSSTPPQSVDYVMKPQSINYILRYRIGASGIGTSPPKGASEAQQPGESTFDLTER